MNKLIKQAKKLLDQGIYDQHVLFALLFPTSGQHYSMVRTAIHKAKVGMK
jgi:hypothetical protein